MGKLLRRATGAGFCLLASVLMVGCQADGIGGEDVEGEWTFDGSEAESGPQPETGYDRGSGRSDSGQDVFGRDVESDTRHEDTEADTSEVVEPGEWDSEGCWGFAINNPWEVDRSTDEPAAHCGAPKVEGDYYRPVARRESPGTAAEPCRVESWVDTKVGGIGRVIFRYEYDECGRLLSWSRDGSLYDEQPDGTPQQKVTFQYDNEGRRIGLTSEDYTDNESPTKWSYEYDDGGRRIVERRAKSPRVKAKRVYEYSKCGERLEERYYSGYDLPLIRTRQRSFDRKTRTIRSVSRTAAGNKLVTRTWSYDEKGRLTEKAKTYAKEDARGGGFSRYAYRDGRLARITKGDGNQIDSRFEFSYDRRGRLQQRIRYNGAETNERSLTTDYYYSCPGR